MLVSLRIGGRRGPKGPGPSPPEVPAQVGVVVGRGPRVMVAFPGTQVAVDVPIRAVRSAGRDVDDAGDAEPSITDVSGGAGAAVAGGMIRNGRNGAGGNGEGVEVEEQSPKEARGGIRGKQLRRIDGFL